jgi:hypothetical protein
MLDSGDKLPLYNYERKEGPTRAEWFEFIMGLNDGREVNTEIISLCDKHFRYGG